MNAATTIPAIDVTYDAFPRSRAVLIACGSLDSLRRASTAVHCKFTIKTYRRKHSRRTLEAVTLAILLLYLPY